MAVKLFPAGYELHQLTFAVNTNSGRQVRNIRLALATDPDEPTNTPTAQLQRFLVWMDTNSYGKPIAHKKWTGRLFIDASSQLQAEPAVRSAGLILFRNSIDPKKVQFLNIPWLDAGLSHADLLTLSTTLDMHPAALEKTNTLGDPDVVVYLNQVGMARSQSMDNRILSQSAETGDDDASNADGIEP